MHFFTIQRTVKKFSKSIIYNPVSPSNNQKKKNPKILKIFVLYKQFPKSPALKLCCIYLYARWFQLVGSPCFDLLNCNIFHFFLIKFFLNFLVCVFQKYIKMEMSWRVTITWKLTIWDRIETKFVEFFVLDKHQLRPFEVFHLVTQLQIPCWRIDCTLCPFVPILKLQTTQFITILIQDDPHILHGYAFGCVCVGIPFVVWTDIFLRKQFGFIILKRAITPGTVVCYFSLLCFVYFMNYWNFAGASSSLLLFFQGTERR